MNRFAALVLVALCAGMAWAGTPDAGSDVSVRVEILDGVVHIEAEAAIAASVREVWEVLTDFENLPKFISNIKASQVLARTGNVVRVAQTGKGGFGPFTMEFQSIRELTLFPFERFESRTIEGNMKRFRGTTRLEFDAGVTRIHYQSEAVPATVLPLNPARSTIEAETREHYWEIGREVLRRKSLSPAR